jgi:hypothetical protein
MEHFDFLKLITLIGFPTIAGFLGYIIRRVRALDYGIQAVLRDRLRYLYKSYQKQGFIDLDDREDWENMYKQYHALGQNGVMDDVRKKLLELPTEKNENIHTGNPRRSDS